MIAGEDVVGVRIEVSRNGTNGLTLEATSAAVLTDSVIDATYLGVDLADSSIELLNTTVSNTTLAGVFVFPNSTLTSTNGTWFGNSPDVNLTFGPDYTSTDGTFTCDDTVCID